MSFVKKGPKAADIVEENIPYLRRYGRALSGNQEQGDRFASETLRVILERGTELDPNLDPKVALFSVFQSIWSEAKTNILGDEKAFLPSRAQGHLRKLTVGSRDVLLLNSLEEFSHTDISAIMQIDVRSVRDLLAQAYSDMAEAVTGRVLIIEDDLIVADEIEDIVSGMGHQVTGSADTHEAAVHLAKEQEPDLIVADVVLADDSSGIEATAEILDGYDRKPVIFVTGHPERLLTGEKREPTFLIPKPYLRDQVRTAVSQALFFSTTDVLDPLDKS